jgi:hypothetical protein
MHFGHSSINLYEPSRVTKAQPEGYASFNKSMLLI